jgi:hypothetical protein
MHLAPNCSVRVEKAGTGARAGVLVGLFSTNDGEETSLLLVYIVAELPCRPEYALPTRATAPSSQCAFTISVSNPASGVLRAPLALHTRTCLGGLVLPVAQYAFYT